MELIGHQVWLHMSSLGSFPCVCLWVHCLFSYAPSSCCQEKMCAMCKATTSACWSTLTTHSWWSQPPCLSVTSVDFHTSWGMGHLLKIKNIKIAYLFSFSFHFIAPCLSPSDYGPQQPQLSRIRICLSQDYLTKLHSLWSSLWVWWYLSWVCVKDILHQTVILLFMQENAMWNGKNSIIVKRRGNVGREWKKLWRSWKRNKKGCFFYC